MALRKEDLKGIEDKLNKICLSASSGGADVLLQQILDVLNLILAESDFEVKGLPPIRYCCDDGSVYLVINCRKYEDNIFIENETFIWDAQTNSEIAVLPACATLCEPNGIDCEGETPRGVVATWGN